MVLQLTQTTAIAVLLALGTLVSAENWYDTVYWGSVLVIFVGKVALSGYVQSVVTALGVIGLLLVLPIHVRKLAEKSRELTRVREQEAAGEQGDTSGGTIDGPRKE